jgi:hypothetical protein
MNTKVSLLLEMNKLYFGRILLRSRDLVASGVKCGPHGGMNSKMKSWTVSWLSLKTKVEPRLRGSQVMSGDWRRVHHLSDQSLLVKPGNFHRKAPAQVRSMYLTG